MANAPSHRLTVLPHLIKFIPRKATSGDKIAVYAFDLDHTIIQPNSGRFSRTMDDWKFMSFTKEYNTLDKLFEIMERDKNAHIVVFSNQGGVVTVPETSKSCTKYTGKLKLILEVIAKKQKEMQSSTDESDKDIESPRLLDRLWIYASPKKPASLLKQNKQPIGKVLKNTVHSKLNKSYILPELFERMRKPNIGMFEEFCSDLSRETVSVKYYCGDAAGRPSDFSDSDKKFAEGLKVEFKLPEDIFS